MIYLLICLIFIIIVYFEAFESLKLVSSIYGFIICFVLILLAGLRDKVGTDWYAYYDFYIYGDDRIEPGYLFINNLFHKFRIPYNVFLLFLNLVVLTLYFKSLKKYAIFFSHP
jgi:hypothetical protein